MSIEYILAAVCLAAFAVGYVALLVSMLRSLERIDRNLEDIREARKELRRLRGQP